MGNRIEMAKYFKTKTKTKQKTDRKSEQIKARGSENLVAKEIFILGTSGGSVNLLR